MYNLLACSNLDTVIFPHRTLMCPVSMIAFFLLLFCPFIFLFAFLPPICAFIDNNPLSENEFPADVISHAFVQTGSELHYFRDISHQDKSFLTYGAHKKGDSVEVLKGPKNVNLFDTELSDFGKSVFGVPIQRRISVRNPTNSNIVFLAISSSSVNFHCSFLEQRSLLPQQQTFFRVFFLPVVEQTGLQREIIYVHTSIGVFSHQVRGEIGSNPYRIRSFLGIRVPLNATFSAPLRLHNPHSFPVRISELFVSDCNVRLELDDGSIITERGGEANGQPSEAPLKLRPFETKEIGVAKVLGNIERNSTSFVLVKILKDQKSESVPFKISTSDDEMHELLKNGIGNRRMELLVIAIGVQVTRRRGLFSTIDLLDFGLIRAGDQISPITLSVYSSLERGIEIESVYAEKQLRGVYLQFESRPPISIKCGAQNQPGLPVSVASVNIDTNVPETGNAMDTMDEYKEDCEAKEPHFTMERKRQSKNEGEKENILVRRGQIIAESRGGNYDVSVPFRAVIYQGDIKHNMETTAFYHRLEPIIRREVTITNDFPFGLAIWRVEVAENGKNAFEASLITYPSVHLAPGQSFPSVLLSYFRKQPTNFSTKLTLHTNLTNFDLPIIVFSGELGIHLYAHRQDEFNFGAVGRGERRNILFTLSNSNPVPLTIKQIKAPFSDLISLSFEGMHKFEFDNQTEPDERMSKWHLEDGDQWKEGCDFVLPAHSFALFNMSLSAFASQNVLKRGSDIFRVETQFSLYEFPINFELVNDHLESVPSKIIFRDSFIGTIQKHSIKLFNTFDRDLRLLKISLPDGDTRFQLSALSNSSNHQIIPSKALSNVATIAFVPETNCPDESCYLGMPLETTFGQWFTYGMKLPQNLAEIDHYLYIGLRRKWLAMSGDQQLVKSNLRIDTDKVKGMDIPVEGHLIWPRLLSNSVVHFPLTAVGNFTIVNLTLSNPSTFPVIVQLLPLVIYPDAELLLDLFRPELPVPLTDPVEMNETLMFSLRDTELFTLRPGSPVPQLREEVEKVLGASVPRFTQSLLLKPGMSTRVRIGFLPNDYSLHSSLLIIRNNLTALEPVVLYGRGARMHMDIDNKTARSLPLKFEIQPHHLVDCGNPRRQLHKMPTSLTVRSSFAVRNSGEVSFSVVNISISNMPCENRGFRVINCDRFRLEPNETTLLDVAYTADFLLSTNEAVLQLYIHMNATPWAFDLVATIPPDLLSVCHRALPRPPFEAMMYYTCVLALGFCFICVVSCTYLEGDRVISCAYRQQFSGQCQNDRTLFDLSAIFGTSPSIFDDQVNPPMKEIPSRKKQFLQVAPNAGLFNRLFWRSVNFILWIFSHIWPLIRGNKQQNVQKKSRKSYSKKESVSPQQTFADSEVSSRRHSSEEIQDESAENEGTGEEGKEAEEVEENGEEAMIKEKLTEEFIQHPKDPEQNNPVNVPSPLVLNQRINAAGIFGEDLDFTDPHLYVKFCSFLNAEKLEEDEVEQRRESGKRDVEKQHSPMSSSTTTTSEDQQQQAKGTSKATNISVKTRKRDTKNISKKLNGRKEINVAIGTINVKEPMKPWEEAKQTMEQSSSDYEEKVTEKAEKRIPRRLMRKNENKEVCMDIERKTNLLEESSTQKQSSSLEISAPKKISTESDNKKKRKEEFSKEKMSSIVPNYAETPSKHLLSKQQIRARKEQTDDQLAWFKQLFVKEKMKERNMEEEEETEEETSNIRRKIEMKGHFGEEFGRGKLYSTKFQWHEDYDGEEIGKAEEEAEEEISNIRRRQKQHKIEMKGHFGEEFGRGKLYSTKFQGHEDYDGEEIGRAEKELNEDDEEEEGRETDEKTEDGDPMSSGSSSAAPEWADQTMADLTSVSLDEDFGALAEQSATLFDGMPMPKGSSSISSASPLTPFANPFLMKEDMPSSSSAIDMMMRSSKKMKADKEQHHCADDVRIQQIVEGLTREYQEKLKRILATERKQPSPRRDHYYGLSHTAPPLNLILPSDLSANCEIEPKKRKAPKLVKNLKEEGTRRGKSPGGELSARLRKNAAKSSKERKGREQSPPKTHFDSLFNIGDPIWKPIGTLDEQLSWPARFSQDTADDKEEAQEKKKSE